MTRIRYRQVTDGWRIEYQATVGKDVSWLDLDENMGSFASKRNAEEYVKSREWSDKTYV